MAATEALTPDEVGVQAQSFVWSGRTAAEWQAVAPHDIVALVRAADTHAGGTSTDCLDPTFLARYDLVEAVRSLSEDDRARLRSSRSEHIVAPDMPVHHSVERVLPSILPAVTQAFAGMEGQRLIGFLGALKQARAEHLAHGRDATGSTTASPSIPREQVLVSQALAQLRLTPAEGHAVLRDYRQLQDGLGPLFEDIASHAPRFVPGASINQEREDRIGFALYRTIETLVTFYWEPVTLDPTDTVTHFLRQVRMAAYNDQSMAISDTRGIEVHDENDDLFGPGSASVEAQVLDDEVYGLLAEVSGGDPMLHAVAWSHIVGRVSLVQLGQELGLSTAKMMAIWATIRERLRAAVLGNYAVAEAAEGEAETHGGNVGAADASGAAPVAEAEPETDGGSRHKRGQASKVWDELVTRNEHYRERLHKWGQLCLLECQRVVLTAALNVATGERNSTIRAVSDAIGGRYSEAMIRRQIMLAADLLERRGIAGRTAGNWMTKEGQWQQRRHTLAQLRENPNFWDSLTPPMQEVVEAYYLQPETRPALASVGEQLTRPLHQSNVSRLIGQLDKIVALQSSAPSRP